MANSGQKSPSDEVAANVQQWRKARGWSYRELRLALEKIGFEITEDVLINVLTRREHEARGRRLPARGITVDELVAFARAFDTSVLHFVPRADPITNSVEARLISEAAFTYFERHYTPVLQLMERKANQEGA
jgi:hypothetical protein